MDENIRWTVCSFSEPVPAAGAVLVSSSTVNMGASSYHPPKMHGKQVQRLQQRADYLLSRARKPMRR